MKSRSTELLLALTATPVIFVPVPSSSSLGQRIDFTTISQFIPQDRRDEVHNSNPASLAVTPVREAENLAVHASERDRIATLARTAALDEQLEAYFAVDYDCDC